MMFILIQSGPEDLLRRIDTNNEIGINVHVFQTLKLIFVLRISLNNISLHLAIFLGNTFLQDFLHCKVINGLSGSIKFLYFSTSG